MLTCFSPKKNHIDRSAVMAEGRSRRYLLIRRWGPAQPPMLFVGLNPSTANAERDDPTLFRLMGFARAWGYEALYACNLFSLVSPHPEALLGHPDPVGPENDAHLRDAAARCSLVLAAWGAFPAARERAAQVLASGILGAQVHCLGQNADGSPKHPLYLPRGVKPVLLEVPHA